MKLIMQLIMQAFVFSGVNVKVDAFSHRPFLLKKWLRRFKSIYCFLWASKIDDFHIILSKNSTVQDPVLESLVNKCSECVMYFYAYTFIFITYSYLFGVVAVTLHTFAVAVAVSNIT